MLKKNTALFRSFFIFRLFILTLVCGVPWCFGQKEEEAFDYYSNEVPLVISASLIEESIDRAPSTMTVFTQNQLRRLGVETLAEALTKVVGSTTSVDFFSDFQVRFRGVPTINVMINGHPLFNPFSNAILPWIDMGIDQIARIEIIRGPGSALYGTNAFGGVVNVITTSVADSTNALVGVSAGSFDSYRASASKKFGKPNNQWLAGVDVLKNDGPDDLILKWDTISPHPKGLTPGPLRNGNTREEFFVTGKLSSLALVARYSRTAKPFQVGTNTILVDQDERRESHLFLDGTYSLEWNAETKVEVNAYYDQFDTLWHSQLFPKDFFIPYDLDGDGNIEMFPDGGLAETDMTYRKSGTKVTLFKNLGAATQFVGGVFLENQQQSDYHLQSTFNPGIPISFGRWLDATQLAPTFLDASRNITGAFAQQTMAMSENISLLVGGRYDHYSDFGGTVNPRLAAVWTINKGNVVKWLYGKAFRAPNFLELYTINNPVAIGNPLLGPEIVHSNELSWQVYPNDNVKCQFNIFYNKMSDLIQVGDHLVPTGSGGLYAFTFENSSNVVTYGGEADCSLQYDQFEPYLRLSCMRAENQDTHENSFNVPSHQEELGINTYLGTLAYWNIQGVYSDSRPSGFSTDKETKAFFLLNSTLHFPTLFEGLKFTFSVKNILDHYYELPSGSQQLAPFPQAGRSITAKASWEF